MQDNLISFLYFRPTLSETVVRALATGGLATDAYWAKMLENLRSIGFSPLGGSVTEIINQHGTNWSRAFAAMNKDGPVDLARGISSGNPVTVGIFVSVLVSIGLGGLASDIERAAKGAAPATVEINIFPLPPPLERVKTSARKRLIQDTPFYVVKVPLFADVRDGASLPVNLLICKEKADALKEANSQYAKDVKAAGGNEDRIPHGYVVGTFLTWHGPGEEEVKNVGVVLGGKTDK